MTGLTERRWYELRDVETDKALTHIRIRAVPYDTWTNVGFYHERVMPRAADKSCREAARGLPLLMFHDNQRLPIGRSTKWDLDNPDALIGEWELDPEDPVGQAAARKARDGFLNGASIGFAPIRSERVMNDEDGWDPRVSRDDSPMQVTRREIRLVEVSLTPTPAYAGTQVELVRTAEPRAHRDTGMSAATRREIAAVRAMLEA